MQLPDYQGEKFKEFVTEMKNNYLKYGFETKPDNKTLANMLGVSANQLYKYFKSNQLLRETVHQITGVFKVSEEEIWGDRANCDSAFSKKINLNMYMVPMDAFGQFLSGYNEPEFLKELRKESFPWIKEECYAFEIEGLANIQDYMPMDWIITTPLKVYEPLVKGRMYMFLTGTELLFRQFESMDNKYIYLKSINPDFNPVTPLLLSGISTIYEKKWTLK